MIDLTDPLFLFIYAGLVVFYVLFWSVAYSLLYGWIVSNDE